MENSLDDVFSALADPTRRAILARLALGEATVGELAEPFAISLPAVSRHLNVLENANLISRAKIAQKRQCALRPEPLKQASDWIDQYRIFWDGKLDALAGYLDKLKNEQEDHDDGDAGPKRRKRNRRG